MEITKQEFKTKSLKVTKEIGRILKEIENNLGSSRHDATSIQSVIKQTHIELNKLEVLIRQPKQR
jgi:hypothetical protein